MYGLLTGAIELAIAAGAWFLWRPLSGVFILLAIGEYGRYLALNPAWKFLPQWTTILFGVIYGALVACVVRFGMLLWGFGWFESIGLGLCGLIAIDYIDFGSHSRVAALQGRKNQQIVGAVSLAIYIALGLTLFLTPGVSPHF